MTAFQIVLFFLFMAFFLAGYAVGFLSGKRDGNG